MPASTRSRVLLPAPLRPINPTRSPSFRDKVKSSSALTTTIPSSSLAIRLRRPNPASLFFRERPPVSNTGRSTLTFCRFITLIGLYPVWNAFEAAFGQCQGQQPAQHRHCACYAPGKEAGGISREGSANQVEQMGERVIVHNPLMLIEHAGREQDRGHVERHLEHGRDNLRQVTEPCRYYARYLTDP